MNSITTVANVVQWHATPYGMSESIPWRFGMEDAQEGKVRCGEAFFLNVDDLAEYNAGYTHASRVIAGELQLQFTKLEAA